MKEILIKDFVAGTTHKQYEYESFMPSQICRKWIVDNQNIINLMGEANRLIGSLDAYADLVPNVDYFIRMHIAKEATTSSKIEGTRTSFEEALILEASELDPERRDDWMEVNNYIKAMNFAIVELDNLPITERLIRKVHSILLNGVRGKNKLPGEFRKSQNWIGRSLKDASFIPPIHTEISGLMSDLEKLINAESIEDSLALPHLIRIAFIHYQFETIHPFLDGNGRIGRLLITLYMIDKKILLKPTLYLSDYFERNRREYYEKLTRVREQNDLQGWVQFFLIGVIETAKRSIQTFKDIISLRQKIEFDILPSLGRRHQDAQLLINTMYSQPILDGNAIAQALGKHPSSSNRLIKDLISLGILNEMTGYKRNRIYSFNPYIEIFY